MLKTISLVAILPALTFAFFIPFPISAPVSASSNDNVGSFEKTLKFQKDSSKICSFVDYIDTVLCNSTETQYVLLNQKQKLSESDTKELKNNSENIKNKHKYLEFNLELDPKDLCPLLELVDKTFCKSGSALKHRENVDPKDLCPLLELIETKLCS
jgi:hypothetical protein